MKTEASKYKSRKSMLVEAYNSHKRRTERPIYEDDFFIYDLNEDELMEKLDDLGNKVKLIASLPSILSAAFLAYLGVRV